MNNNEITEYMHRWRDGIAVAKSQELQIMGAVMGIVVLLAEIAKRLPEVKE